MTIWTMTRLKVEISITSRRGEPETRQVATRTQPDAESRKYVVNKVITCCKESSPRRRPGSSAANQLERHWIPACAGMTGCMFLPIGT